MSQVDGNVRGINKEVFQALQKVQNPRNIKPQEVKQIQSAMLKDGQIDTAEHELLQELTAHSSSIKVDAPRSSAFQPTSLIFGPAQGQSRSLLQTLEQIGPRFEDAESTSGQMSMAKQIAIATDITGLLDPSPISDGISGAISLSEEDWGSAALSGISMFPYFGDAAGKPAKIFKRLLDEFPHLGRMIKTPEDVPRLLKSLEKLGPHLMGPGRVAATLNTLN
ncbi:MAG: hypothetical protein ACO1RX_19495 [Candidatus Sericytochromatia bacterium]